MNETPNDDISNSRRLSSNHQLERAKASDISQRGSPVSGEGKPRSILGPLQDLLGQPNVSLDRQCSDIYMQSFCEQVHVLFPILHLASLHARYTDLFVRPSRDGDRAFNRQVQNSQILPCLALGKHSEHQYNRVKPLYAPGRTLYSATLSTLGDPVKCLQRSPDPLLTLQCLVLMVR